MSCTWGNMIEGACGTDRIDVLAHSTMPVNNISAMIAANNVNTNFDNVSVGTRAATSSASKGYTIS